MSSQSNGAGFFLSEIWRVARSPAMAGWRVPVAVGWLTIAISLLLVLPDCIQFSYHSTSGIQGWVSANKYPKQQDLFWFLAAVAGVPVIMLAGWVVWLGAAAMGARLGRCPPAGILKVFALLHLPLLAVWPRLWRLQADAWNLLLPLAGGGVVLAVLAVLFVRFALGRFTGKTGSAGSSAGNPEPVVMPRPVTEPCASGWTWWSVMKRGWAVLVWVLLFVAVPVFLYVFRLSPVHNGGVDFFHEGEGLVPLNEILRGGVPYRDIYLQHGLLLNAWVPWLGAKLFEPTLAGVRTIQGYIQPLGGVGIYYLILVICRTGPVPALFLAFLCCGSLGIVTSRAMFGLLSITVLAAAYVPSCGYRILAGNTSPDTYPGRRAMLGLCFRHGGFLLLAGGLAMLAFWYSVETGLYAFAAGGVFLLAVSLGQPGIGGWRRILPLACYGVGAVLVFMPVGLYLGMQGALDDFGRNIWIQCVYQNDTWGQKFPSFFSVFKPILIPVKPLKWPEWLITGNIQWYYGPVMFTLASAYLAFRAMGAGFWRSRTAPLLLLVTLTGICFFRTVLGRSDSGHIQSGKIFALVLALFLCDCLLAAAWDRLTARGVRFWYRLLGLPWLVVGLACSAGVVWFGLTAYKPMPGFQKCWDRFPVWPVTTTGRIQTVPRAGKVVLPEKEAEQTRKVIEYIVTHSRPDEPVFDFAGQAGYLFFADRPSATRYFQVCYASLPAMQEEVIQDLERQGVSLVIYRTGTYFDRVDGVPTEKRHPLIAAYLASKFEPAAKIGPVAFWQRKAVNEVPIPTSDRMWEGHSVPR